MSLTVEHAELIAFFAERGAEVRAEMRETIEKSDALLVRDIDRAYAEIEQAADAIVRKGGGRMSRDAAVSEALHRNPSLYDDYLGAQDLVRTSVELAEGAAGRRSSEEWMREHPTRSASKEEEAAANADLAAYAPVDRPARALLRSRPELSYAQAVDAALKENPGLYEAYTQELNTGAGVAGPSPFGAADGTPVEKAGAAGRARTDRERRYLHVLQRIAEKLKAGDADVDAFAEKALRGDPELARYIGRQLAAAEQAAPAAKGTDDVEAARRRHEDPVTGAAIVAKSEDELWDVIVEKSGASPTDPEFSRIVDAFLSTGEGQQLYAQYERAYEARSATAGTR